MIYRLACDWADPIRVPDENLMGVFRPRHCTGGQSEEVSIQQGLAHPIGAGRLRDEVCGRQAVLILSDDVSRPTPVARLLPYVLEELFAAGLDASRILILMALGTHREMTDTEIDRKLGPGIRNRFRVVNHDWKDLSSMECLGRTSSGTEIFVNRLLTEVDYVIGLGNVVPHPAAGFSGGGKIVNPG